MSHVVVEVWDPSNSTLVQNITSSRQIRSGRFGSERNRVLDCNLTVDLDHPNEAVFTKGRIVRVIEDGQALPPWRIVNSRRVRKTKQGKAGRVREVKGRTLAGDFAGSVIEPARGINRKPVSRDRVINFASIGLPTTSWTSSYSQWSQWESSPWPYPERWTSPFAVPQWSRSSSATQPEGTCYARTPASGDDAFTLDDPTNCVIVYSADDSARVWCDGDYLGETEDSSSDAWPEIKNWMNTFREPVRLEAGTHVLAFECLNRALGGIGTRAGLYLEVWSAGTSGLGELLYASSTDTLIWADYPDDPPNFEVGRALNMLLAEAQAKTDPELVGWETSFSDTLDSNGEPWPILTEQVFRAGVDTFGTVVDKFGQSWCDWDVDDEGLVLHAYVKDTTPTDSGVEWGLDEIQELSDDDGDLPENVLYVATDDEMRVFSDPASISAYGMARSAGVSIGSASSAGMEQVAEYELASRAWPSPSVTFRAPTLDGKQPWKDFRPSELVTLDSEEQVVSGIVSNFGGDTSGRLVHSVELSTLQEERVHDRQRLVTSLEAGWSPRSSTAPPLDRGFRSPSGRYGDIPITAWSWGDFLADEFEEVDPDTDPDDIEVWQPFPAAEPMRLWQWEVQVTGEQEPWGTTKLILMTSDGIAGAPVAIFILELGISDVRATQRIWGAALVERPKWVMPGLIADGGHSNGSVRIYATEAR